MEREEINEEAKRVLYQKRKKQLEETNPDPKPPEPPKPELDIELAIANAIDKYDTLRKSRKEQKRIQKEKELEEKRKKDMLKHTVQQAVTGGYKPQNDPYKDCFNFSF